MRELIILDLATMNLYYNEKARDMIKRNNELRFLAITYMKEFEFIREYYIPKISLRRFNLSLSGKKLIPTTVKYKQYKFPLLKACVDDEFNTKAIDYIPGLTIDKGIVVSSENKDYTIVSCRRGTIITTERKIIRI